MRRCRNFLLLLLGLTGIFAFEAPAIGAEIYLRRDTPQVLPETHRLDPGIVNLEERNARLQESENPKSERGEIRSNSAIGDGLIASQRDRRIAGNVTGAYVPDLSIHFRFLDAMFGQMISTVKRLSLFNERRMSSSSFNLLMMGAEGDDGSEAEEMAPGETEAAVAETAPAEPAETEPVQEGTSPVFGDINGNGTFDFEDAVFIAQLAYGLRDGTDAEREIADLDGDGEVSKKDAMLAVLVYGGVLSADQAKEIDLADLLDSDGNYVRQGSEGDASKGTIKVWQKAIGDLSEEDMMAFMQRLIVYLQELKKMLASAKHATVSEEDEALLDAMIGFAENFRQGKYNYGPLPLP